MCEIINTGKSVRGDSRTGVVRGIYYLYVFPLDLSFLPSNVVFSSNAARKNVFAANEKGLKRKIYLQFDAFDPILLPCLVLVSHCLGRRASARGAGMEP